MTIIERLRRMLTFPRSRTTPDPHVMTWDYYRRPPCPHCNMKAAEPVDDE